MQTTTAYQNLKNFLDYILQNMEDEINRKKLDIDGVVVADKLNIKIDEMEEMLELFARFYIFFKHFFKGNSEDPTQKTKSKLTEAQGESRQQPPVKNGGNVNSEGNATYTLNETTAGNLSDFCLLFKNKDFNPTELKEKFPKLFDLWQEIPILFNLKVSNLAEELSDKLRKHKAVGKKPKQLTVGNVNFKIEYS
jgi:hypothetical protein